MSFGVTEHRKNTNVHAHAGWMKILTSATYERVEEEEYKVP